MTGPLFEWDTEKASANIRKHGIAFERAITAFTDAFAVEAVDSREDYGEERIHLIGMSGGILLHVTYTERASRIRIISARLAGKIEQDYYYRENSY
jgi:uncharacterized DUF497 family protein